MSEAELTDTSKQGDEKSNVLSITINVFTSPQEAFKTLNSKPSFLFPLVLIMVSTMIVYYWYFSIVDNAWYIDDTLSRMGDLSDEQLEAIRGFYSSGSQSSTAIQGTLLGSLPLLVVYVLQAGYLALASSLNGDGYRFKNWFSLICWTSLPSLLVVLVMAVNILLSPNGQISILDANSLSLSSLGMEARGNTLLQSLMDTLNLPMFWSIALVVMAYKQWVKSSIVKALWIVLTPYALIFGIWTYFAIT